MVLRLVLVVPMLVLIVVRVELPVVCNVDVAASDGSVMVPVILVIFHAPDWLSRVRS